MRFFSATAQARPVDGPFAEALSEHLGRPIRLMEAPTGAVDRGRRGGVSLISRASLDRLAQAAGETDFDARRFRMLIEVDGLEAHEEDGWVGRVVQVGDAEIRFRGHVGRCLITSRDPETGHVTLPTLDILGEYRRDLNTTEPLPFGIYGEVVREGIVRVGDVAEPSAIGFAEMSSQRVQVDVADHVATVTLTRPDKHNALDIAMFDAIIGAAERLRSEPGIRAVVLHGEGPSFCSGLDLVSLAVDRTGRRWAHEPAPERGAQLVSARRLRLDPRARARDRRDPRQLPRRRPPDRPGRRHPDRHARREAVGDGDQVGPDPRHVDHADAPPPGRHRRGQGARLHRARVQRRRRTRAGRGHPRRRRSADGGDGSWRPRSPNARPTPCAASSGYSTRAGPAARRRRSRSRPSSSSG